MHHLLLFVLGGEKKNVSRSRPQPNRRLRSSPRPLDKSLPFDKNPRLMPPGHSPPGGLLFSSRVERTPKATSKKWN